MLHGPSFVAQSGRWLVAALVLATRAAAEPVEILTAPPLPARCLRLLEGEPRPSTEEGEALLSCFEVGPETTTRADVTAVHVAAGSRFFVELPRALERSGVPNGFAFLGARAMRARALALLNELLRWKELDEAPEKHPTGHEAPFGVMGLDCQELDALSASSHTAIQLLLRLKRSAGCPERLSAQQRTSALRGSSLAMESLCVGVTDEDLRSHELRSLMLRATHFDTGRSGKPRTYPGADACLARLGAHHAAFVSDTLLADSHMTLTVGYLGKAAAFFTLETDPAGQVRVFASNARAQWPERVRAALAPGSRPRLLSARELKGKSGDVRTFTLDQPGELGREVVVLVVDVDGAVSIAR